MTDALSTDVLPPLTGFTVGITAARRREELGALLERRGAKVVHAPAIRLVPLEDDKELRVATQSCIDDPPDIVIATTGIGFRGWMEAADGWDLGDPLREHLRRARLLARGPKALGALRTADLREEWSPESESMSEVLSYLLSADLTDVRVAVQLHGEPLPDFIEALNTAGANVVTVPVYRWEPPVDPVPLVRMVELTVSGGIDAITFTSAPAAASLLQCAAGLGLEAELVEALHERVLAACVGPVTAGPLERRGVKTAIPDRPRLGNLVRIVVDRLPTYRARLLPVHGHLVEVRGHAVILDNRAISLPPLLMTLMSALAEQPGRVLSRAELLSRLPGAGADEHSVEMAVTRLRAALGDAKIVQTVVKRGYRLAYDPESLQSAEYGTL